MKDNRESIYAEQREKKERDLDECRTKLHSLLKPNPTEEEKSVINSLFEQIDRLISEIEEVRLHQKFKKHIGVWIDELDSSYSDTVFSATLKDLKTLRKDYKYADELISIIGRSYQELEALIRGFFSKRGLPQKSKPKDAISIFITEIEKIGEYSKKQMRIIRAIIKLRNWLTHDVVKEEQEYTKKYADKMSGLVDMNEWSNYYYTKLAITKNMLYEAIDLFANYEGSVLRNV